MKFVEFDRPDETKLQRLGEVARKVYRHDPVWAPASETILASQWAAATAKTYPLFRPILAEEDGCPVARAVAILKHGAVDAGGAIQGYIGFFECLEGRVEAAQAVLRRCEDMLRRAGAKSVQAPKADNQLFGCQVSKFDLPHVCLTPHNPPYYLGYFEAAGYTAMQDVCSLYFRRESAGDQIAFSLPGFSTREFDRSRLTEEVAHFHSLQPKIFGDRSGYVPRTAAEDREMIEGLLPHIDDEMIIIAEDDRGYPVGIMVCLPDFFQKLAGQTVDRVRIVSVGILPDHVNKGIGTLMGVHLMRNLLRKNQYVFAEASLVLSRNIAPQNLANRFRASLGRQFVVLEKTI